MMKYLVYIAVFLLPLGVFGQDSSIEIGGGVGVSSYYGDINQDRFFYNPNVAFDGLIRYNFNKRYAVRFGFMTSKFRANDLNFKNSYQQSRRASFSKNIQEISIVGEVNLFPYVNPLEWGSRKMTVYTLLGFANSPSFSEKNRGKKRQGKSVMSAIWGIGCKRTLGGRWAIEVEWAFRKCFKDRFDGVVAPIHKDKQSAFFNNDFYNVLGVRLVYNLWEASGKCRTFEKDSDL